MKAAHQTTEDPGNIIQLLGKSEIVKAAIAETAAAQTLARRGLIGQVRALERAHERAVPKLEAALADAMTALKTAETAVLAAQRRAAAALGAKSTASHSYSGARDRLEQQLRATAHPAIAGWVREMQIEIETTRKRCSFIEQREVVNPVVRLARRLTINNLASVGEKVAAIMKAVDEAERLALELDDQTDIPRILGEMAAGLPPVEDPKL